MKKITLLLLILSFSVGQFVRHSNTASASGVLPWGRMFAMNQVQMIDIGVPSSVTLDAAYVPFTSGDIAGVRFSSPVSQASGPLEFYAYCTASPGTSDSEAVLYQGATGATDDDRPDRVAIATSTEISISGCSSSKWIQYSFPNARLNSGGYYFIVTTNTSADPVTNSFNIQVRGGLDTAFGALVTAHQVMFGGINATDGFAADPTVQTGTAPMVIKFANGEIMGNPYVGTFTLPNNTNWRGDRVTFTEDTYVGGFYGSLNNNAAGSLSTMAIYDGASVIFSTSTDLMNAINVGGIMFPSVLLRANRGYDFVFKYSANSNVGTTANMGQGTIPADVMAVNPNFYFVGGATPGSFTASTTAVMLQGIIIDTFPPRDSGTVIFN